MPDQWRTAPLENVQLGGPVGEEIHRVIAARIASPFARDHILAEAVAAFQNRMDDRLQPGAGLWQGEFWGKWTLSAVAAWRYTGDETILETIRDGAGALLETRRKDGYIGTYHDSGFVKGNSWNVWCRKYTLWGLLDAGEALQDPRIIEAAQGLMDHLMTEVGPAAVDILETGNFFGLPSSSILTPVLKLHRLTGEDRYAQYADYIVHRWSQSKEHPPDIVGHGLSGAPVHRWFPNAGPWTKAYEFISCVEGLLDLYRLRRNSDYLAAARNIHQAIRAHERVITGGIGYHDKLLDAAFRPDGLNEPCDVVYWQRLNLSLLRLTGEPEYADEIERLAWNVLMTAMNRHGTWGLRRLGLSEPHLIAVLHCGLHHHHCCVDNLPRGLIQLAEAAVMTSVRSDAVAVNFLVPAQAELSLASGLKLRLEITTDYPVADSARIRLIPERPAEFALRLRIPPWSPNARVAVDREPRPIASPKPGAWLDIQRLWRPGDTVHIRLDLSGRVLAFPGAGNYAAVARGPIVLARSDLIEPEPRNIHAPVALELSGDHHRVELTPATPPPGARLAFDLSLENGKNLRLLDYASTGKDFQKPSPAMPWPDMVENRTAHALRVWLPVQGPQEKPAAPRET